MERSHQQRIITIDRGLFLVRYAAAEDQEQPPRVRLSSDPLSKKDITFVLYPDENEPILEAIREIDEKTDRFVAEASRRILEQTEW